MQDHIIQKLRAQRTKRAEQVAGANTDLAERMEARGVSLDYDPEADYLYITIGDPQPGMAVAYDGWAVIVSPEDYKVLAIEVPFFLERIDDKSLEGDFWRQAANWVKSGRHHIYIPSLQDRQDTEKDLRQLVLA